MAFIYELAGTLVLFFGAIVAAYFIFSFVIAEFANINPMAWHYTARIIIVIWFFLCTAIFATIIAEEIRQQKQ